MKKILSIMLAVLMIAGLCTFSAFAAEPGIYNAKPVSGDGVATLPEDGSKSGADVVVTINGEVSHRYAVEITFNNPTFVYSTGSVWDVEKHQYVPGGDPAEWIGEGKVEIKNHSDLAVNYDVAATKLDNIEGYGANNLDIVLAGVDGAATSAELAACPIGATYEAAPAVSFTYKVDGKPTVAEITAKKIGEIVVTIKPVTVTEP